MTSIMHLYRGVEERAGYVTDKSVLRGFGKLHQTAFSEIPAPLTTHFLLSEDSGNLRHLKELCVNHFKAYTAAFKNQHIGCLVS